jgi:hypothetical protein
MEDPQRTMDHGPTNAVDRRPHLSELAASRLRHSPYLALQHVSCEFRAGVLILRGRLPSYYLKQIAQAVVASVERVERIDNRIEVVAHAAPVFASEPKAAEPRQPPSDRGQTPSPSGERGAPRGP